MEAYEIYLVMPENHQPTGEYRAPKRYESYLAKDNEGDWSAFIASRDHSEPQIILKEIKKGKKSGKKKAIL